ncbi:MAG: chorismate mutase [Tenericutes bacterium 4572_104]|nr:MAG: chorismate mutase [Tenericutes bacterium 4572_104]
MEKLREEIDIIDKNMQNLFIERMQIVKKIAEYKLENQLPVFDLDREKEIIKKNIDEVSNYDFLDLYEDFFKKILELSKKYQERISEK